MVVKGVKRKLDASPPPGIQTKKPVRGTVASYPGRRRRRKKWPGTNCVRMCQHFCDITGSLYNVHETCGHAAEIECG